MSDFCHIKTASKQADGSAITPKPVKVPEAQDDRNGGCAPCEDDSGRVQALAESEQHCDGCWATETDGAAEEGAVYRLASFFSGIGGFELGFERAGFTTAFQCEVDPFCVDILEQHWPRVARFADIREVTNAEIPVSDVWAGGFPCQDLSLARMGKRDGLRGRKSRLFHEFARLLGEGRPPVAVIENVPGLLSSHGGRDFAIVLGTLAELGYSVGWRTLNSKNFGVPQSRKRVYIVGCHRDRRGPGAILFESQCGERDAQKSGPNGEKSVSPFKKVVGDPRGDGPVAPSLAYCLYACSARHTGTDWSRTYVSYPGRGKVRRLTPSECEGVMAFPKGWTVPRRRVEGSEDLDTMRYQALGNAVTPPVAEWLACRTKLYLASRAERVSG